MAAKQTLNCLHQLGTTGVSLATSNVLNASGTSQEFPEFAAAKSARFYLNITAITGSSTPTMVLELDERDPATGLFFASPDMGVRGSTVNTTMWSTGGYTSTQISVVYDAATLNGNCYQLKWTLTGTSPVFTCTLLALLQY